MQSMIKLKNFAMTMHSLFSSLEYLDTFLSSLSVLYLASFDLVTCSEVLISHLLSPHFKSHLHPTQHRFVFYLKLFTKLHLCTSDFTIFSLLADGTDTFALYEIWRHKVQILGASAFSALKNKISVLRCTTFW